MWACAAVGCLIYSYIQEHSDHTDHTMNISDMHPVRTAHQTTVALALDSCRLQASTAVTLRRAGTSSRGGSKPQPSVDHSHSGSFKITSVPMSVKQQMTVGADHMWVPRSKLSHLRDENTSEASEEFWNYTSLNGRDKCGELLDKCHHEELCRSLWTRHRIPNIW